jgi:hypothetical protein
MPYSVPTFDSELELYFRQVRHDSVVDIGPGEGKYGKMLRRVHPETKLIGVESIPPMSNSTSCAKPTTRSGIWMPPNS